MIDLLNKIKKYIDDNYYSRVCSESKPSIIFSESIIDFRTIVQKSFSETLLKMIDDRKLVDTDVYKKANIDRRHFSKMRNLKYHPRKNTVIKFIFALELNIDEADELLMTSGYALSTGDLRDVIIMYFIENKNYDLITINNVLEYYKQEYI